MKSVNWCGIDSDYNRFECVSYVKLNIPFCVPRTVFSSVTFFFSLSSRVSVSVFLSLIFFPQFLDRKCIPLSIALCALRITTYGMTTIFCCCRCCMCRCEIFFLSFAILIYLPLNASDPCKWSNLIKTSKHFHSSNEI